MEHHCYRLHTREGQESKVKSLATQKSDDGSKSIKSSMAWKMSGELKSIKWPLEAASAKISRSAEGVLILGSKPK